jgi:hypothetical protein
VPKRSYTHRSLTNTVGLFSYIEGVSTMDLDVMLTLSQAARAVGQSRQLIYNWRERGLLDTNDEGKVRLGSVLDAEARTRRNRQPGAFKRGHQLAAV